MNKLSYFIRNKRELDKTLEGQRIEYLNKANFHAPYNYSGDRQGI